MSPRRVCKLERFKECSRAVPKTRSWQEFCCQAHRLRFRYLVERRRMAKKRNRAASNACSTHSRSRPSRRYVEVGSIRKGLELAARLNPEFIRRLAASLPEPETAAA